MKTGRLSKAELHFIEEKADSMTADQIAKALNRSVDPIIRQLKRFGKTENKLQALTVQAEYDIKAKPHWKELKKQLSEEELELFLFHWTQIIAQFHNDILPTEELQIIDLVRLEILVNRESEKQHKNQQEIDRMQAVKMLEEAKQVEEQDKEYIYQLERNISSLYAAGETAQRAFKDLLEKKTKLSQALKATREQRYANIENKKSTMAELIEKILRDPKFFDEQGKQMEKMRLAMEKERERLSDYHTYDDNVVDRPFLTPDIIKKEKGK